MTEHSFNKKRLLFLSLFFVIFATLQYGYGFCRDTVVDRVVIDLATVKPSVAIINAIMPTESVRAEGHRLVSPSSSISVLNGCEGIESMFLLLAAIIAFRSPLKQTLMGVALGVGLLYILNQLRIVSLYFAWRFDKELFSLVHGYVGPTIIVVIACAFFVWWSTRTDVRQRTA